MSSSIELEHDYSPNIIDPSKHSVNVGTIKDGTNITIQSGSNVYALTIVKKIGSGGFGTVHKCTNSKGDEYAIKKMVSKASTMMSYNHPSLNRALAISADLDGIYILMDIAKYDLHGLLNHNKLHDIEMTIPQYRNILYRVAQGVSYLHQKGLVHGDVKCSNVLYYSDNDIRLTDFNLTTMKKWKSNIHLCTAIYRPLEIWLEKEWCDKIDIWSYGCMMYDLLYDYMLFPFQGNVDKLNSKNDIRRRYINAIIDWANFNSPHKLNMDKYNINYHNIKLANELITRKAASYSNGHKGGITYIIDRERETYINLMLRCLQVLARDRPHIDTVISDQFFFNSRNDPNMKALFNISKSVKPDLNKNLYSIIENSMVAYTGTDNKELLKISSYICSNYAQITGYDNYTIKKASVWMAKKLLRVDMNSQEVPVTDKNSKETKEKDDLLNTEIDICNKLNFKLYNV